MRYNWQLSDWPNFTYDLAGLEGELIAFADKAGQITGLLKGLSETDQIEAMVQSMLAEAMKTSQIEGEYLRRQDVMSSIRNQLGLNDPVQRVRDRASEGAAELMVAVRDTWKEPLTEAMLFSWHKKLLKGSHGIALGRWRTHKEPMQVVSNPYGRTRVHFEAPPSDRVPGEMKRFVNWFNRSESEIKHAPVRSAIAHLYFESVHPFEDGNGRIGRALSEKAIFQGLGRPAILSLSHSLERNKKHYYDALQRGQGSNEISDWISYFVSMLLLAQDHTGKQIDFVLRKARFFDRFTSMLSERQLRVIRRMLEEGPDGFEGGINARKYRALTRVSKATATRDLQDLATKEVLRPIGAGRSARYDLRL